MAEIVDEGVEGAGSGRSSVSFWPIASNILWFGLALLSMVCLMGASKDWWWNWLVILAWPLVLWIAVVVHELGHAAAAMAVGWRVVAIAMGPLAFHLTNRDFAWVPRSKRTEAEGFVVSMPASPADFTIARDLAISAGGPAANFLLAAILFAAFWWWPDPGFYVRAEPGTIHWSPVFSGAALVSLMVGLGSLIPAGQDRPGTDGDRISGLLRVSPPDWRRYRAHGYVGMLLEFGTRLRNLPLWMVDEVTRTAKEDGGVLEQAHKAVLIGIVLDSPPVDVGQARAMLDAYRADYGASEWLDSCDAYFGAVWEEDGAKARSLLWPGAPNAEILDLMLAAEAAVLAREDQVAEARARLQRMREVNRAKSIFPDHTFRDIGRQIEANCPTRPNRGFR